jgi:hypothetical protein
MIQDIAGLRFRAGWYLKQRTKTRRRGDWRKECRLPKDPAVTLITGYRADLRWGGQSASRNWKANLDLAVLSALNSWLLHEIEADVIPWSRQQQTFHDVRPRLLTPLRSATEYPCVSEMLNISHTDLELILKQRSKTLKGR